MEQASDVKRAWNRGLLTAILATGIAALVSGIVLLPLYKADAKSAHLSVSSIQESPIWSLIRAMHHWASALLILLGVAYLLTGLARAVYRKPGQTLWLSTLVLFILTMLLQLTGHLLPWDQHDVRTAYVETNIAASAPVIGDAQATVLRAGDTIGPSTLRLWYIAHIGLLTVPFALILFSLPLMAKRRGVPFNKLAWGLGALFIIGVLAFTVPAPLGRPGSSFDYDGSTKPEWYVLPMHSLLNLFQRINPKLGFVGTMVIPGLAILLLAAMPWLEKRRRDALGPIVGGAAGIGLLMLTALGARNAAPITGPQFVAEEVTAPPQQMAIDPKLVAQGRDLFKSSGCDDCHKINGVGGKLGPDLSAEGLKRPDIAWHVRHLIKPEAEVPGSTMPSYSNLRENQLQALAHYVVSLRTTN